jgi:DNA-binding response OmpR family regulator
MLDTRPDPPILLAGSTAWRDPAMESLPSPRQTIVIVDDHPSFLAAARFALESEGFDVIGVATDGESALRETVRSCPQIVLLDVSLPDMDGFEVASRLRAAGVSSTIVFTSSRDGSDFGSLVTASGGAGFIAKAELSGDRLRAVVA